MDQLNARSVGIFSGGHARRARVALPAHGHGRPLRRARHPARETRGVDAGPGVGGARQPLRPQRALQGCARELAVNPPSVAVHPPSVAVHPPSVAVNPPSVAVNPPS
eukprot:780746-Prorocentrum_minimum.AAC.1